MSLKDQNDSKIYANYHIRNNVIACHLSVKLRILNFLLIYLNLFYIIVFLLYNFKVLIKINPNNTDHLSKFICNRFEIPIVKNFC